MYREPVRRVTRGYVWALAVATVFVSVSLIVAAWGLLSLALGVYPVISAAVPMWVSPLLLAIVVGLCVPFVWRQAVSCLRGRVDFLWFEAVVAGLLGYVVWSLGGVLAGMSLWETWLSPFAGVLVPIVALALLLYWLVLCRRVFTSLESPSWPWEKRDALGDGDEL